MRTLLLTAILFFGCATAHRPAPAHGPVKVDNTIVGIEALTLYSATSSTGQNLVPSYAHHNFATCISTGGTFWLKRHTPDETPASVTSPIPSANTQASDGWSRITDGTTLTWGVEGRSATQNEQIYFISEYAEVGGHLACVWH